MEIQWRCPLALLLSLAAHLGLGLVIGIDNGMGPVAPPMLAGILTVHLGNADGAAAGETKISSSPESTEYSKTAKESSLDSQATAQRSVETPPMFPIRGHGDVRYFQLNELTQKPFVAHGLVADTILVVPGVASQPATVQLWINDRGDIDHVTIEDSSLSEEAERLVIAAFSKVKFHPGRIGRIPVRSQLRMEIMLESVAIL